MPSTPSIMSLHLRYRLWIAELNQDITILRILNDYLLETKNSKMPAEVKTGVAKFEKQFTEIRNEIDELKHLMHLLKMKLAADARAKQPITKAIFKADNHLALEKRYRIFRKLFDKEKKDFIRFESKWF